MMSPLLRWTEAADVDPGRCPCHGRIRWRKFRESATETDVLDLDRTSQGRSPDDRTCTRMASSNTAAAAVGDAGGDDEAMLRLPPPLSTTLLNWTPGPELESCCCLRTMPGGRGKGETSGPRWRTQ